MGSIQTTFRWEGGEVSGAWHRPAGRSITALVLAHGAGYNMNTRLLLDIAAGLAERGIAAVRFNFPYIEAGRRVPDTQPRLEACYRAVATAVADEFPGPFLGGKSMGGRIASHVVADGFSSAGLVFLGYPLHPPGKAERIRDAHLTKIGAPMLFLQGTRDPFAKPDLLRQTLQRLPSTILVQIVGGDHSFKVPWRDTPGVAAELVDHTASFIERLTPTKE